MKTYDRGDTPFFTCDHETYDFATDTWSFADPDTGYPTITIIDSKGVTKIPVDPEVPTTMNRDAKGKFQYLYTIAANAEVGDWYGYIDVKNGGYPDRKHFAFTVK
ncbi:hypothetical protein ES703_42167 [subsurface metagenome]